MAEQTKRTLQDVNREYAEACVKLGDLCYKIRRMETAKSQIERSIIQLDKEALRLGQKEQGAPDEQQPAT